MNALPDQLTVDLLRANFAREIHQAACDAAGTTTAEIGRARGQRRVGLVREWNRARLHLSLRLEQEPQQAQWLRNARDGAFEFNRGRKAIPGAELRWQDIADVWPGQITVQGVQQRSNRIMANNPPESPPR